MASARVAAAVTAFGGNRNQARIPCSSAREEEEGERRLDSGRPCLPPVVAGRACDEHQELGSFWPAKVALATAEKRSRISDSQIETLAAFKPDPVSPINPLIGSFSLYRGGWSLTLNYYYFPNFNAQLCVGWLCMSNCV